MDPDAKKQALRGITYGLYVISTADGDDVNAFAGNWVTQTSFDPPLVALGVKQGTTSQELIARGGVFAVNVLEAGQKDLAAKFFKPVRRVGNKFEDVDFTTGETGAPILADALRFFECRVVDTLERGDHWIYVGEVVNAGVQRDGAPLTLGETGWSYGG
ncbi:MAG: flavin reductase family protein [Acidimicrobiia bacterium]|nr:flavin reductase family protein [Acidimicrobiia bacterium]